MFKTQIYPVHKTHILNLHHYIYVYDIKHIYKYYYINTFPVRFHASAA